MMSLGSALEAESSGTKSRRKISRPLVKGAWTMATVVVYGAEAVDEVIVEEEEVMCPAEEEVP